MKLLLMLTVVIHKLIDTGLFMAFLSGAMHSQVFPHAHFGRWPQLLARFVWQFVYLLVEASASLLDLPACGIKFFPCLKLEWAWMCGIGVKFKVNLKIFCCDLCLNAEKALLLTSMVTLVAF